MLFEDATQLAAQVASKERSPVEIVQTHLRSWAAAWRSLHRKGFPGHGRRADAARVSHFQGTGSIAAGMSPLGLGSDVAISVRGPAAHTGIVAIKATHGRIPTTGHWPKVPRRFWHVGPMAKTVRDGSLQPHGAACALDAFRHERRRSADWDSDRRAMVCRDDGVAACDATGIRQPRRGAPPGHVLRLRKPAPGSGRSRNLNRIGEMHVSSIVDGFHLVPGDQRHHVVRSQVDLSNGQIAILGNCDCREIHHRAYRRCFAQVSMNHKPDVACEPRNVPTDPDEIVVFVPDKAG